MPLSMSVYSVAIGWIAGMGLVVLGYRIWRLARAPKAGTPVVWALLSGGHRKPVLAVVTRRSLSGIEIALSGQAGFLVWVESWELKAGPEVTAMHVAAKMGVTTGLWLPEHAHD